MDRSLKMEESFHIEEGLAKNRFLLTPSGGVHMFLKDGSSRQFYFCFAAGNSGIFFNFEGDLEFTSEPFCDELDNIKGAGIRCQSQTSLLKIKDLTMDSIKLIREMRWGQHKERIEWKKTYLEKLNVPFEGYLFPKVLVDNENGKITISKTTLDNKNRYLLEIRFSGNAFYDRKTDTLEIKLNGNNRELIFSAVVDYEPLAPWGKENLLNDKGNAFRTSLKEKGGSSYEAFEEALQGLSFLSYHEKFLAGSWRFLTYFGRDTMLSIMLLEDVLKEEVFRAALGSVIKRLSDEGRVAHEEDIGEYALTRSVAAHLWDSENEVSSSPIYFYKMVDDDFMLTLMLEKYLDKAGHDHLKKLFFNEKGGENDDYVRVLRNFDFILSKTRPYFNSPVPENLIRIAEDLPVGDWRDSHQGLGFGNYPSSVNVGLVPSSLRALKRVLDSPVFDKERVLELCISEGFENLRGVAENSRVLAEIIDKWEAAKSHFQVFVQRDEIRERLRFYFEEGELSEDEKKVLLNRKIDEKFSLSDFVYGNCCSSILEKGIPYKALALDDKGMPVEVINTDPGFTLFFGEPSLTEVEETVKTVTLPYPLGLAESGGLVVANAALSKVVNLIKSLNRDMYHGTVVWSWQMGLMKRGLMRQLYRFRQDKRAGTVVRKIIDALDKIGKMEKRADKLVNSELWTHKPQNDEMVPVPFGVEDSNEEVSNPVQLWSTLNLILMPEMEELEKIKKEVE